MAFIPDEKTTVLTKPTASFIPDEPKSSFVPDKPTSSFIPDKPSFVADVEKPTFNIRPSIDTGIESAKQTFQKLPIIGGFTPEQITKGQQVMGEAIERPIAGLRGVSKEGLGGFKKGLLQPEKYPVGTFSESLVNAGMEPISAGALGTLADAGYYFGMPEALTRIATAGKVKLIEGIIKNVDNAILKSVGKEAKTIPIRKDIVNLAAKDTDMGTVLDAYLKSKNFKLEKATGLLEYKPLAKDIKPSLPQIVKPTPSFVPEPIPTPVSTVKAPVTQDLKGKQGNITDYEPGVADKMVKPTLERLKGETIDQAIERSVGYQIDNGKVKLTQDQGGWKATVKDGEEPKIIRAFNKQEVLNQVYDFLNPEYGIPLKGETGKIYYHQTSKDIETKIKQGGFSIEYPKARETDPSIPDGVYFKSDTKNIGVAETAEDKIAQIPIKLPVGKTLTVENPSELRDMLSQGYRDLVEAERIHDLRVSEEFDKIWHGARTMSDEQLLEIANKYGVDLSTVKKSTRQGVGMKIAIQSKILADGRKISIAQSTKARAMAAKELKDMGYDYVYIKEDEGSFNRKTDNLIVLPHKVVELNQFNKLSPKEIDEPISKAEETISIEDKIPLSKKESAKNYRDTHKKEIKLSKQRYLKENPWFSSYQHAKQRVIDVKNIKYPRYGGRGIKFNMTLQDFKDMWFRDKAYEMKKPSVDRINIDGDYSKENTRFIELSENTRIGQALEISQYSKDGKYIKTFRSLKDAEINTGVDHSDISKNQLGKIPSAGGYVWKAGGKPKQPPQPKTPTGREGFIKVDMLNPARWDEVRQFIEDDWLKVKRLIQQKGTNVTDTNNPYEAEIRYWGRIGARTEEADNLISAVDKDIVTTAKKLNISDKLLNKEVDRFLIARHAPERNAQHGENAAGMTDKQAYEIRAEIAGKPYAKEVERIADEIQTLNNKTLDILLEGEVINKELYDKLRTMYKNHIPLNRVMSEEDDIIEVLTKRGFDVQGAGIKRAKGSDLEIADILTNVTANYKTAIVRAEKNIVDNYTLRFARENEYFDGLFEEVKARAIGKTFDGKILLEQIKDPKILPIREKGNQVYLKINDAQLAMALRGVNRQKVDGLMRGVKAFTRFYSGLMTRFNPEFVVSNKIRDLQEVAVYLASKNEIGFKGTAEAIIKDPISVKDVTDAIRGKDTEGAKLYKQMKMDGGTTGGMGLSIREQLEIDIDRIRSINRSMPRKAAEIVLRSIDAWNTIFEDSSRLSVYRQALKQGLSRNKAAVLAKEASVNFNKMGTGSPVVNALYMFSNASVQGTAKMLRAMRNPKVLATVLTLLGGAVFLVNEYNDKKDKDWRKKISKWDRLNGFNIVISTNKGIKYVTIPISWGLKPIKVFFDSLGDIASGYNKSVPDALSNLVASTIEAYNPAGGTDIVSTITPSILDLPVDIARNRSWTGGKIRPDWNNSAPASIQYFDSLRKKLTGQKLIEATKDLGDKGIELSPADMNYAFEQLIGGTGRAVTKTLNTIVGVAQGKPQAKEIPFVSRFYRDISEEEIRESGKDFTEIKRTLARQDKNRFYLGQEAELAWDGMKQIPIENRKEHYMEIRKSNPILADKIKEIAKEEQANLTYNDRLIKKLGVENGERSKYLWNKIDKMGSAEERKTFYLQMKSKNVITDEVARQIKIRAKR